MGKHTALYDTLGVTPDASSEQIKKSYHRMALKHHPDKNQGDLEAEKRFVHIKQAYDILSDPKKKGLYDRLGEDAVKISEDPSSFNPTIFMNIIHSADVSIRGLLFTCLLLVAFGFFWFFIVGSLRLDGYIHWKWWVVTLPLLIVDPIFFIMDLITIPMHFARYRRDKDLSAEERTPIGPLIIQSINGMIFVISHFCFIFRLDNIWKVPMTVSLIPYFIYSLNHLYMPYYLYKTHYIEKEEVKSMMTSFVFPLTILLCCLKYDQYITCGWGMTFLPIWIVLGLSLIQSVFLKILTCRHITPDSIAMSSVLTWSIIMTTVKIIVAIAILCKIAGIWRLAVSWIIVPIMGIIMLFAVCILCMVGTVLFSPTGNEVFMTSGVDVETGRVNGVGISRYEPTMVDEVNLDMD